MPTLDVDRHADANWRAGYRQGRTDARRPPSAVLLGLAGLVGLSVGRRRRSRRSRALSVMLVAVLLIVALAARVALWVWPYRLDIQAAGTVAAIMAAAWCWWPRRVELVDAGLVVDSGDRRRYRGRDRIVWRAVR